MVDAEILSSIVEFSHHTLMASEPHFLPAPMFGADHLHATPCSLTMKLCVISPGSLPIMLVNLRQFHPLGDLVEVTSS